MYDKEVDVNIGIEYIKEVEVVIYVDLVILTLEDMMKIVFLGDTKIINWCGKFIERCDGKINEYFYDGIDSIGCYDKKIEIHITKEMLSCGGC